MLPSRCFRCYVGSVTFGIAMLLAFYWFGPIGFVLFFDVSVLALMILMAYWSDLKARKGRGANTLKDKGF